MSESVNIDLSGEINASVEKKGLQKYVNDVELLMQHVRSGGGQALLMGFLASRRPWTQFVATDNFKCHFSITVNSYGCKFFRLQEINFWSKHMERVTVTVVALHASLFDADALPPPEDAAFPTIEQV
ncbi:hypothetical protein MSG28_000484 [Choristoneura fumiferana]|uniref:Uncharacterized protein n=1 Tax=Choristoneura fumiferana TaxID=7141 RepID=A0ACC0K0U1_CHOFU|nr:hypothetical protein MSG28_000484 [Choristoneura fumiferana]